MKALLDLMYLVTRHKRKQLNVIGYDTADDRYELFYDKLEKGEFNSDDEAAAYFFGSDKDGKFTQYKNFKNKFFRRLTNATFHLDLKKPEFNEAQVGFYNCWKNLALAKFLGVQGAYAAAKKVILKTLPAAIKFEITEIVLEMSRLMLFHYTAREPDNNKRQYYKDLVLKSLEELMVTVKAETMYVEIIAPFVLSRSSKPWIGEKAKQNLKELKPHIGSTEGYRFHLYYFLIKKIEREISYDYFGVVEVCKEALLHFEKKESTPKTTFAIFGTTMLVGLTMMGEYEEAEKIASRSLSMVQKYSVGWYKTQEMNMALKLHKRDYQKAYEVLNEAVQNRRFNSLPPAERESWKIYEGYVHLLIAAGRIEQAEAGKRNDKFRPSRFLNEMPNFSKDKRGMNIPVLIIHAIYLLYEKRYDESYDRMLALEKYNDRHLKEGDDTFRTWCFLQALLQIQKADFKKDESEKRAAEFLRRMSSQPVQYLNAPHEVEAIPYEHLWEMAMQALSR
jgi:hypothetical protein